MDRNEESETKDGMKFSRTVGERHKGGRREESKQHGYVIRFNLPPMLRSGVFVRRGVKTSPYRPQSSFRVPDRALM